MARATRLAILIAILAVAVRLIWINQPYVDEWSWRQSDVAAIARNYFQGGFHFARPQIDWAGDQPGYVGTEFPILPFAAATCYKFFGIHEWLGRIQAVIFFAISLPFFFLLVRKTFGELAATWALFFYSFAPLGIMAGRCFMPDTPSLALSIVGLYLFLRWADTDRSMCFVVSAVCISTSILIKATSVVIAAPLACVAFQHFGVSAFRTFKLWLFAAVALVPAAIWYWSAYQISLKFYPYHFFGAGGIQIVSASAYLKIGRWIFTSTLTPVLFVLGMVGAVVAKSNSRARSFHWWLGGMIAFFVVVGYGNRHQWYQLPLIPICAAFAGAGCAAGATRISNRPINVAISGLVAIAFSVSALFYAKSFYRPTGASLRAAGLALKRITPPNSLIAAADNGDPTVLYYAVRKGWHILEKDGIYYGEPKDGGSAIAELEGLRAKGASYFVLTSNTSWWLDNYPDLRQHFETTATLMEATPELTIYRLSK